MTTRVELFSHDNNDGGDSHQHRRALGLDAGEGDFRVERGSMMRVVPAYRGPIRETKVPALGVIGIGFGRYRPIECPKREPWRPRSNTIRVRENNRFGQPRGSGGHDDIRIVGWTGSRMPHRQRPHRCEKFRPSSPDTFRPVE